MKHNKAMRILAVFLAVLTVFGTLSLVTALPTVNTASAATVKTLWNKNLKWSLSSTGTLTISGKGAIPDYVEDTTRVGYTPWKAQNDKIKKIVVKKGVTGLGASCFSGLKKLTSVTLPSSLKKIRDHAFKNCEKLRTVTIPSSVEYIEGNPFEKSGVEKNTSYRKNGEFIIGKWLIDAARSKEDGRKKYTLSCEYAASEAFDKMEELEELTIGASVKKLCDPTVSSYRLKKYTVSPSNKKYSSDANGVLYTKYKTVLLSYPSGKTAASFTVPSSVTAIGAEAFFCAKIKSVSLPAGLKELRRRAFMCCNQLSSVTIPSSISTIGDHAFAYCSYLKKVSLPKSLRTIGEGAFSFCGSLTSLPLPSGLKTIGDGAFTESDLSGITLPASVSSVDGSAFSYCFNLSKISVSSASKYYSSKDGVLFNKAKTKLILYPVGKEQDNYTLPKTVTRIGEFAFSPSPLKTLTIKNKDCSISTYNDFGAATLRGYKGSTAQTYAKKNNITFKAL